MPDDLHFNAFLHSKFRSLEDQVADVEMELRWIRTIEQDNNSLLEFVGFSAACFNSITDMVSKGQQIRVLLKFHEAFFKNKLLKNRDQLDQSPLILSMPRAESSYPNPVDQPNMTLAERRCKTKKRKQRNIRGEEIEAFGAKKKPKKKAPKRFSGGHVCEPILGAYSNELEPTLIHDFASLYPSIIQGYNICYMRLVYDKHLYETKWRDDPRYVKEFVPINDHECIVLIKSVDGVPVQTFLPQTTAEVCQERKRVRALMKNPKLSKFEFNCLNAKQLACKVFQNALYGFLGVRLASNPLFACPVLMAMVCCIGQFMIKTAKDILIRKFLACIVYGDTDSLMSQFPVPDHVPKTKEAVWEYLFKLGFEIQKVFSTVFPSPNVFEFEAVKFPFLLFGKKNYASLQYMSGDDWRTKLPGLNISGLNFKKRDKCRFVREIGTFVMDALLRNNLDVIMPFLKERCAALLNGKISIEDLTITCSMRRDDEYGLEDLIQRISSRKISERTGKVVESGDRMEYAVHEGKEKYCERGDSPEYITEAGLKIDKIYYFEKQLKNPIDKLFMHHSKHLTEFQQLVATCISTATRQKNRVKSFGDFMQQQKKRKRAASSSQQNAKRPKTDKPC